MKQNVLGFTNYNIILMQHDLGILFFFLYLPILFKAKRI